MAILLCCDEQRCMFRVVLGELECPYFLFITVFFFLRHVLVPANDGICRCNGQLQYSTIQREKLRPSRLKGVCHESTGVCSVCSANKFGFIAVVLFV